MVLHTRSDDDVGATASNSVPTAHTRVVLHTVFWNWLHVTLANCDALQAVHGAQLVFWVVVHSDVVKKPVPHEPHSAHTVLLKLLHGVRLNCVKLHVEQGVHPRSVVDVGARLWNSFRMHTRRS